MSANIENFLLVLSVFLKSVISIANLKNVIKKEPPPPKVIYIIIIHDDVGDFFTKTRIVPSFPRMTLALLPLFNKKNKLTL